MSLQLPAEPDTTGGGAGAGAGDGGGCGTGAPISGLASIMAAKGPSVAPVKSKSCHPLPST